MDGNNKLERTNTKKRLWSYDICISLNNWKTYEHETIDVFISQSDKEIQELEKSKTSEITWGHILHWYFLCPLSPSMLLGSPRGLIGWNIERCDHQGQIFWVLLYKMLLEMIIIKK